MKKLTTKIQLWLLAQIAKLSWKNSYRLSDFLNWLLFSVFSYRKNVIRTNLRNSFITKSDSELLQIERDFQQHFTDLVIETVKLQHISKEELSTKIHSDLSLINRLYLQGKSAVFVIGHRGNWEIANLYVSLYFPHDCIIVYKPLSSKPMDDWFGEIRTQFGSEVVPMRQIYTELKKPREKPYIVFLVNDQSPNPTSAYWTTFLNQDTGVFKGAEVIARTFDLAVIYGDIKKDPSTRGRYHLQLDLIAESPMELPENGVLEASVRNLEKDILKQPANWLWTHKRWKHKKPLSRKHSTNLAGVDS